MAEPEAHIIKNVVKFFRMVDDVYIISVYCFSCFAPKVSEVCAAVLISPLQIEGVFVWRLHFFGAHPKLNALKINKNKIN